MNVIQTWGQRGKQTRKGESVRERRAEQNKGKKKGERGGVFTDVGALLCCFWPHIGPVRFEPEASRRHLKERSAHSGVLSQHMALICVKPGQLGGHNHAAWISSNPWRKKLHTLHSLSRVFPEWDRALLRLWSEDEPNALEASLVVMGIVKHLHSAYIFSNIWFILQIHTKPQLNFTLIWTIIEYCLYVLSFAHPE